MTHYFAYGSNLDETQMAERCPMAKLVGKAWLPGYRLFINQRGYANVLSEVQAQTIGLLWELTPEDEASLDLYEGCHRDIYTKCYCTVTDEDGKEEEALVYIDKKNHRFGYPEQDYIERIIAAAKKHDFPEYYQAMLQFWCDKKIRKDLNRFHGWLRSAGYVQETFSFMSSKSKATEEWHKACPRGHRVDGAEWLKKNQKKLILRAMRLFESQKDTATANMKKQFFELILETISNSAVAKIDKKIGSNRRELKRDARIMVHFIKTIDALFDSPELQKIIALVHDPDYSRADFGTAGIIITSDPHRNCYPTNRLIVTEHAPAVIGLWHHLFNSEGEEDLAPHSDYDFVVAFADATEASLNESTETVLRNILQEVKKAAQERIGDIDREDDWLRMYTDPEDDEDF
ncbi:MAG: gamma-glutamylcyclotransferase [Candidatus Hydrogenedens sp.]|jgi:cation transport regulator ChaC|nr:gamma-glutamylcyclotransferase [Candidatus Hydrogenedens sp.]